MANYSELLPDILPHVKSCPTPSIQRALVLTATDFFQRCKAYTLAFSSPVTAGDTQVTVTLPANTRLVAPMGVFIDGDPLETVNNEMLAIQFGDWRAQTPGTPRYVMIDDIEADELVVALTPNGDYTLSGRVAIRPTRAATTLDDNLMELYGEGLAQGALARLLNMKNTEWYDPKSVPAHARAYAVAVGEATQRGRKENTSRFMTTGYGGL